MWSGSKFSSLLFFFFSRRREWNGTPWKLKNVIQFRSGRKETINFRLEMRKVVLAAARCVVGLGLVYAKNTRFLLLTVMHACTYVSGFPGDSRKCVPNFLKKEEMKKKKSVGCVYASICLSQKIPFVYIFTTWKFHSCYFIKKFLEIKFVDFLFGKYDPIWTHLQNTL